MRRFLPIFVVLVTLLGAAIYLAWREWTVPTAGGVQMNGNGMAALVIGAIGSLILGGGLMALIFLSARRGYDDAADFHTDPNEQKQPRGPTP
ncbi:MAG TPA: hypothetical protein VKZ79_03745 [Alphaproteobacteria bacterium]|nr:hypothetical protein [Alphaproteobacteria bacterium]